MATWEDCQVETMLIEQLLHPLADKLVVMGRRQVVGLDLGRLALAWEVVAQALAFAPQHEADEPLPTVVARHGSNYTVIDDSLSADGDSPGLVLAGVVVILAVHVKSVRISCYRGERVMHHLQR